MKVNPLHTALLLTPATALIIVLLVMPVVIVAVMSLTNWQFGAATLDWVGLANYRELWTDTVFRKSISNTLVYLVVVTVGSISIGLGAALLIESDTQLRAFYRTAFFMPVASTLIAMAVVWQFLLHPNVGLVNQALGRDGAA
jgi:multiple sugar transport system permease protein